MKEEYFILCPLCRLSMKTTRIIAAMPIKRRKNLIAKMILPEARSINPKIWNRRIREQSVRTPNIILNMAIINRRFISISFLKKLNKKFNINAPDDTITIDANVISRIEPIKVTLVLSDQ